MTIESRTSPARPFAVITGASSGIGYELAKQFAANHYDVLIVAEDGIEPAADEIAKIGARVQALTVDLGTPSGIDALVAQITSVGRTPDAVAINAGVGAGGDFRSTDLDAELRLIDVNCRSTVALAKRIVPLMTDRGAGKILFTASIASLMPDPFEAVYGASKAFVHSFALALRDELKDTGVTVTALMPGPTETNFLHRAGMDDTKVGADANDDPADVARQGFEGLMGGKAEVIAGSLKTKAQAAALRVLPETAKAQAHRRMAAPGSADK